MAARALCRDARAVAVLMVLPAHGAFILSTGQPSRLWEQRSACLSSTAKQATVPALLQAGTRGGQFS